MKKDQLKVTIYNFLPIDKTTNIKKLYRKYKDYNKDEICLALEQLLFEDKINLVNGNIELKFASKTEYFLERSKRL